MRTKKMISLLLIVLSFASVFAISICAAGVTQIRPNAPEFTFNINETLSGHADYTFGTINASLHFNIKKGSLIAGDVVDGSCFAAGDDAEYTETYVKVWATNWLTGEKTFEGTSSDDPTQQPYISSVSVPCDLWHEVTRTYHEGTVASKNGDRSVLWISGSK